MPVYYFNFAIAELNIFVKDLFPLSLLLIALISILIQYEMPLLI